MQALQEFVARQMVSAGTLTALAAALDVKAGGPPLEPGLAARVDELLDAVGAKELLVDVDPQQAAIVRSMIRAMYLLDAKLLFAHTRASTWSHAEPEILQSIGETARIHAINVTRTVVPSCDGLADRFRTPGATVLDVGVGVAASAIALAQMWPELRIVGLDPWEPSIRLARENVERAGLSDRFELRLAGIEALDDESAYDFVWFANTFIPLEKALAGIERARRALRPGGFITLAAVNDGAPRDLAALFRLRETQWGGPVWSAADVEEVLRDRGYVDVQTLPAPPSALAVFVVGRRAPVTGAP